MKQYHFSCLSPRPTMSSWLTAQGILPTHNGNEQSLAHESMEGLFGELFINDFHRHVLHPHESDAKQS